MGFLGFWVIFDGVKHIIKNKCFLMLSPTAQEEVRQFIGFMKNYSNMWAKRSHTLTHLTKITSIKLKCKWAKTEKEAFR